MTKKEKRRSITKGWMPVCPKTKIITPRCILMLMSISTLLITSALYTLSLSSPQLPIFPPPDSDYPNNDYLAMTGDLEGNIITVLYIKNTTIFEADCRSNWHVQPGLYVPKPPVLTFVDNAAYWKGDDQDFTGLKIGHDFELVLQWAGIAKFGFWWNDSVHSYKLIGKGQWTIIQPNPLIVSIELPEAYIYTPRDGYIDRGYITLWSANSRPIDLTVLLVPVEK